MWQGEPEVPKFLRRCMELVRSGPRGEFRRGWSCIELGSQVMHDHDCRPLARQHGCGEYVGVDHRPGPGVDEAGLIKDIPYKNRGYDLVLSISSLEHDPDWVEHLQAMAYLVKPHGVIGLTVPGYGWAAHEVDCSPGGGHYRNVSMTEACALILSTLRDRNLDIRSVDAQYVPRGAAPHWPRGRLVLAVGEQLTEQGRHGLAE